MIYAKIGDTAHQFAEMTVDQLPTGAVEMTSQEYAKAKNDELVAQQDAVTSILTEFRSAHKAAAVVEIAEALGINDDSASRLYDALR